MGQMVARRVGQQFPVIGFGLIPGLLEFSGAHLIYGLGVFRDCAALLQGVPVVTDSGVKEHQHAAHEYCYEGKIGDS